MKLSSFYEQAVKFGNECDPRSGRKKYSYADTALLYGDPRQEIEKVLVGIDIDPAEILLADRIRQRQGLDLVISHHPEGRALAGLYRVMQIQVDVLKKVGVSATVAQGFLDERMRQVQRGLLPNNSTRSVDVARLLDIPFICIHTAADNHAYWFLKKLINEQKPRIVQDIIDILMGIEEYKLAEKELSGPRIILGSPKRRVGKILFEMTGGTEGPQDVFDKLYKAGVRTLVSMHLSEEHFKKVKDANLNAVIAGHISSDNLGLNLLLDKIERKQKLEITSCSGFQRIKRG